jgi:hypothetical protein
LEAASASGRERTHAMIRGAEQTKIKTAQFDA